MIASDTPVSGVPRLLLRLEGAAVLAATLLAYGHFQYSWGFYALLFLAPDLSLAAYLAGRKPGTWGYNIAHTELAPGLLAGFMALGWVPAHWDLCLIWVGHIGFDRALGVGLKYPAGFKKTHLGRIGRASHPDASPPLSWEKAHAFAEAWIRAWNAHDLDAIMHHYDDQVELVSPVAAELLNLPGGRVAGKEALRVYFKKGLEAYPALQFNLKKVLRGLNSVVLYYENQKGAYTGEFMEFSEKGKVSRIVANYGE